jgi:hypothetical protein
MNDAHPNGNSLAYDTRLHSLACLPQHLPAAASHFSVTLECLSAAVNDSIAGFLHYDGLVQI